MKKIFLVFTIILCSFHFSYATEITDAKILQYAKEFASKFLAMEKNFKYETLDCSQLYYYSNNMTKCFMFSEDGTNYKQLYTAKNFNDLFPTLDKLYFQDLPSLKKIPEKTMVYSNPQDSKLYKAVFLYIDNILFVGTVFDNKGFLGPVSILRKNKDGVIEMMIPSMDITPSRFEN